MINEYSETPVGYIESPFREKFGIPRQSGIISTVESKIRLTREFSHEEYVRGLEEFSHIWIIFKFHKNTEKGFSPLVRPPRLGGNRKTGVFASRSPFRPNFIGMSAVRLISVEKGDNINIVVSGADILDKTPVLDIKPYIKFADAIESADCGEFQEKPGKEFDVEFSDKSLNFIGDKKDLINCISEVLSHDIRPAYYKAKDIDKVFGMKFESYDIKFRVNDKLIYVEDIIKT